LRKSLRRALRRGGHRFDLIEGSHGCGIPYVGAIGSMNNPNCQCKCRRTPSVSGSRDRAHAGTTVTGSSAQPRMVLL
jgi:hypothetical protein